MKNIFSVAFLRKVALPFLILYSLGIIHAQQVSVLPQFFATNPVIKRDPTFEELHRYLTDAKNNTPLGLTENFSKRIDELELAINEIKLEVDVMKNQPDKFRIIYRFFGKLDSSNIFPLIRTEQRDADVAKMIGSLINSVLLKYPAENEFQSSNNTFNKIVLYLLSSSFKLEEIDIYKFVKIDNDEFRSEVNNDLKTFLNSLLSLTAEDFDKDKINIALAALVQNIKAKMIEGLYELREILDKTKSNVSKTLVSANTGIGINEDAGNFGGGLVLTFRSERLREKWNVQGAMFISGITQAGASSDSRIKQPFLSGVQLDIQVAKKTQIGLLASYKYNEEKLDNRNWLFEGGLGFLSRTNNDMIWGFSAFYQVIDMRTEEGDKVRSIFTSGFTVRSTANTSPVIMMGVSYQEKVLPVIQISYPINFEKQ